MSPAAWGVECWMRTWWWWWMRWSWWILDASLSPADTIIWDYRPILQKFIRYLDNIS